MSALDIPLELVLRLIAAEHGAFLGQLSDSGATIHCVSTVERGSARFALQVEVGDQRVQTEQHPWIADPLVEELAHLLGMPRTPRWASDHSSL